MKKWILLLMVAFSMTVLGVSRTEGLGESITSQIKFFMTRNDLEKSIQKKSVLEEGDIIYYENVIDPIGVQREVASFMFYDNYGIVSAVFSSYTTPQEHKKIVEAYRQYFKNVPESKLKKLENSKADTILYYNDKILLQVKYFNGNETFIIVQIYSEENLQYRINEIKNLK